ncbi:MAG: hypothetical protein COA43_15260 [Robiginitomaculum sp.]|nr:MAG: hypothetical protein COA43_15260 [Robiginitomaculum sp.]
MSLSCSPTPPFDTSLSLNQYCYCLPIERVEIERGIISASPTPTMASQLSTRENYFASTAVFVSTQDVFSMKAQIKAIEDTINTDIYQQVIFARNNPSHFLVQSKTKGMFMGYDFHMTPNGPRLIEINTNAGGAFIVNALENARGNTNTKARDLITQMFLSEWKAAERLGVPKTIAIVDENPKEQFHYPDMCLAADMLREQGFKVFITDVNALTLQGNKLYLGEHIIDIVYNRLTDFTLSEPKNKTLRQALENNAVVVSPSPRHHALYADKRNLTLLSDMDLLSHWGISKSVRDILSLIPNTIVVTSENTEYLWKNRRQYFFKPHSGFGSRATYRGAKLTSKVWRHINANGYIAQKFIAPPLRAITYDGEKTELKFDLRVYTYDGTPILYAARIYQGQTTNLRTKGGGLAPVIEVSF